MRATLAFWLRSPACPVILCVEAPFMPEIEQLGNSFRCRTIGSRGATERGRSDMAATLRIEPAKPEWLTLERACFGFEAMTDGRRFSFETAYAMINFHALKNPKHNMKYKMYTSNDVGVIILYDRDLKQNQLSRKLDEIPTVAELSGDKYKSIVYILNELGLPDDLAMSFTLTREFLTDALLRSLDTKFARAFARVGSPLAGEFTEIPVDSFRAFKIEHFRSGYATANDGSRLFSIHIAPEGGIDNMRPTPSNLPPKQASLARYIISEHGGWWPDSQWKPLLSAFAAWTDVQTGARTSIGRSLAADLKRRFPSGFNIDARPLNNFGR
jgi:hypothetical protein